MRDVLPALLFAAAAGCFNPTYQNPACGPAGECPSGLTCIAGTCSTVGDDAAVEPDADTPADMQLVAVDAAPTCFGTGVWELCTNTMPTGAYTLPTGAFDTSPSNAQCTTAVTWTSATQPDSCIVSARDISITTAVSVVGSRPLVLFADTITISTSGVLDVASHRGAKTGPAVQPAACNAFARSPANNATGGGGGAGGSFVTNGGDGGNGGGGALGGVHANAVAAPSTLRGGCQGQPGGDSSATGGATGQGGGAVYLAAGTTITIAGVLNASGAGGVRGQPAAGGGGGGSGGMIVLTAPSINATNGRVLANGGGGGGAGGGTMGQDGLDPNPGSPLVAATGGGGGAGNGCGGNGRGGNGAAGSLAATAGEPGQVPDPCGGGGGGGGIGYIRANVTVVGGTFSPATDVP